MTKDEFDAEWAELRARLTPGQCDLLDTVVSGAEVNYSLLYMAVAWTIGVAFGWVIWS